MRVYSTEYGQRRICCLRIGDMTTHCQEKNWQNIGCAALPRSWYDQEIRLRTQLSRKGACPPGDCPVLGASSIVCAAAASITLILEESRVLGRSRRGT